jgi:hypothetical protein
MIIGGLQEAKTVREKTNLHRPIQVVLAFFL